VVTPSWGFHPSSAIDNGGNGSRVKPGTTVVFVFPIQLSKSLRDTHPPSRGRSCPRFAPAPVPSTKRAQGKPGARCTRDLVCKFVQGMRTRAYRSSGGIPAFPARRVTAYFALSSVTGFLATVICKVAPANLAPASGRQDHTTSPSASATLVSRGFRVHRISPRVRDDRDPPLSSGETRGVKSLICPTAKAEFHPSG
jgi:hypothetical protein